MKEEEYFYDYENRLIEVQTAADETAVEYTYNALGRRSQKLDKLGFDDVYVRYYYNKDYQVLSETDEDDAELRTFIYGRGLDEVLVMTDAGTSDDYYYINDHLNSPVAIADEDGDVIERYEYDAYGQPTYYEGDYSELEATLIGNPYYFTGRRIDFVGHSAWMIQYNRNRFYDYYTGCWLNQDPIGYQDGVNLYQYGASNPIMNFDPMGLDYVRVWDKNAWWIIEEDGFLYNEDRRQILIGSCKDGNTVYIDGDENTPGCTLSLSQLEQAASDFWNEYPDISGQSTRAQNISLQGVIGRLCEGDELIPHSGAVNLLLIDLSQHTYATADGIIPWFDPFTNKYAYPDGSINNSFIWSRAWGEIGRDVFLTATVMVPNAATWVKNIPLYEIGQMPLKNSVFLALQDLTAIQRGRVIWQMGLKKALQSMGGPITGTKLLFTTLPTPGGAIGVIVGDRIGGDYNADEVKDYVSEKADDIWWGIQQIW